MPDRIRCDSEEHTNEEPQKSQTNLPELEIVYVLEDDIESTEEQVQDAKQYGREQTQVQAHRLQKEQHERAIQRMDHGHSD